MWPLTGDMCSLVGSRELRFKCQPAIAVRRLREARVAISVRRDTTKPQTFVRCPFRARAVWFFPQRTLLYEAPWPGCPCPIASCSIVSWALKGVHERGVCPKGHRTPSSQTHYFRSTRNLVITVRIFSAVSLRSQGTNPNVKFSTT